MYICVIAFVVAATVGCMYCNEGCCDIAGPSVPIFKRDTALPVWWTIAHDLLLLKLIVRHGCGQWRRNIFTSSNKDAKSSAGQDETVADLNVLFARSDFEMPVKEFGQFTRSYYTVYIL